MLARIPLRIALGALLFAAAAANAQIFRAYLASDGNDANPCTLAQPCRLLPAALAAVASGGEIWMLDSANYNTGTVTIGKSVSILAVPGSVGSLVALNGGSAVSITTSGLDVSFRNMVFGPVVTATAGTNGITMTGNSKLTVEGSLFARLPIFAIFINGAGTLKVSDTIIRDNGGHGIWLENGARATISSTRIQDNAHGVLAQSTNDGTTTIAVISDSIISGGGEGVYSFTIGNATTRIMVVRSTIDRTNVALRCATAGAGSAEVSVGGSAITNNASAWNIAGPSALLASLGNNHMHNNGASTGVKGSLSPE